MVRTHNTKASVLLIALLSQLATMQVAQAASASEWGPWAQSDNPPATNFNFTPPRVFNTNPPINSDQTRYGNNQGELLEAAGGEWVGYVLYSHYTCTAPYVNENNKLATLALNPVVVEVPVSIDTFAISKNITQGSVTITSSEPAFNMSFDTAQNHEMEGSYSDFNIYSPGEFNGQASTGDDANHANHAVSTDSGPYGGDIFISRSQGANNPYTSESYNGSGYFGKVMSVADIASLARVDNYWYFRGSSYNASMVDIYVNFNTSTWEGGWGGVSEREDSNYNSFQASGSISGAKLTGTVTAPTGVATLPNVVQSGTINGTIVGSYSAETANIIGSTTLNVGAVGSTRVVNDVFSTSGRPNGDR